LILASKRTVGSERCLARLLRLRCGVALLRMCWRCCGLRDGWRHCCWGRRRAALHWSGPDVPHPRRNQDDKDHDDRDPFFVHVVPPLKALSRNSTSRTRQVSEGASNLRGECEAQQGDALRPIEARGY
jgi:hypothetical protein